jgi:DNA segregation ATPase FtsK/SpoIIIE-like protein
MSRKPKRRVQTKRAQTKRRSRSRQRSGDGVNAQRLGVLIILCALITGVSLAFAHQGGDHVLGKYLGTGLSAKFHFLFGKIPSWICVIIMFVLGWNLTKRINPFSSITQVLLIIFLLVEICAFLSLNVLPLQQDQIMQSIKNNPVEYTTRGGVVGVVTAVHLLKPLFHEHVWGARFILSLVILFTLIVWTGIKVDALITLIKTYLILTVNGMTRMGFAIYNLFMKLREKGKTLDDKQRDKLEKRKLTQARLEDNRDTQTRKLKKLGARTRLMLRQQAFREEKEKLEPVIAGPEGAGSLADFIQEEEEEPRRGKRAAAHIQDLEEADKSGAEAVKEPEPSRVKKVERPSRRFMDLIMKSKEKSTGQEEEEKQEIPEEAEDLKEEELQEEPAQADEEGGQTVEAEHEEEEEIVYEPYEIPPLDILPDPTDQNLAPPEDVLKENSNILETKLGDFGIDGKIVAINPGPVITQYEVELAPGIRIAKVENLANDLAMAMAAKRIRIVAPIPGKSTLGIEVPNRQAAFVYFKEVARDPSFLNQPKDELNMILGKTITGVNQFMDITRIPHQLIGGQTGAGKSVCINSLICSVLLTKTPDEVRFIMIDPKVVEFGEYNSVPHLLSPVVTEPREALRALKWACIEMDRRYRLLARVGARNIIAFNKKVELGVLEEEELDEKDKKRLPYVLIVIDELADLMLTAAKEVEAQIARIAQLSRAVGIHLLLATQSPRTTVITGVIKANLPSRIAFQVAQMNDSRTILDQKGAEKLLGNGDMLYLPSGSPEVHRVHGSFISDDDIKAILDRVKEKQVKVDKISSFGFVEEDESAEIPGSEKQDEAADSATDAELVREAAYIVVTHQIGSTSLLQRRLKVGYARAGRLMDELEDLGIVGPPVGSKAREVLVESREMIDEIFKLKDNSS